MGWPKNIIPIAMFAISLVALLQGDGQARLVAHWTFDEGSGTEVRDTVGGLIGDLSAAGASLVSGGKAGGALSLDKGTGGYVTMGDVLRLGAGPYSFVVWVKTSTTDTDTAVLSKHWSGSTSGYFIGINSNGSYGAANKAWFYNWYNGWEPLSSTTVNDDQWRQIVAVRGNGFVRIYVDGLPIESTQTDRGLNDPPEGTPFLVGGYSVGGNPLATFTGMVDDLQVYDHALSDSEVQWLFTNPGQTPCAPAGLVSWWKAENSAEDSFGDNDMSSPNAPGYAAGRVNKAFRFNGTTQYLQDNTPQRIPEGNTPRTVLAWIKWAGENSVAHQNIFSYGIWGTDSRTFFFERRSSTGKLYLTGYNNDLSGNTVINPNVWYLVAVTHDGTTTKLFVNGAEDGSGAKTLDTTIGPVGIIIGDAPANDGNHGKFNGLIDEVAVFNRALSQQEIAAIYSGPGGGLCPCAPAPSGLVAQWKAEGNASDFIGNHHGTWVNGPAYATGEVGQAFEFDGVDDYVNIATLTSQNIPATFTISGWVKAKAMPGDIVNLVGFPGGYQLDIRSNGKISFGNAGTMVDSNASIAAEVYRHIAASFEAGIVKIYIDGSLDKEGTTTTYSSQDVVSLQIGGFGGSANTFFNGMIDEVQVFSRALQAGEIAAIHEAADGGLCGQFDAIPGLRLWLKADSGLILGGPDSVTTWEDRSGNGLDVAQGTEANQPAKVSADLNGLPVVRFDGVNDYLIRSNVMGVDLFDNSNNSVFIIQKQVGTDARTSTFSWTPPSTSSNRFMVHATWDDAISYQIGNADIGGGGALDAPQPYGWDDRWHVLKLWREGNNGQITVDGIGLSPNRYFSTSANNSVAGNLYVGADWWSAASLTDNWFTGDIAEILVFNRALTAQEQQTIDYYLRGKYGLTNTPDAFAIPDKADQALNSPIESAAITVSGITLLAPISISTGGEYALSTDGGSNWSSWTNNPGIVKQNDQVKVRQTSSPSFSTTTEVTLTIGGVPDTFSVTTVAADTAPDTFSFTDQTGVPLNTEVVSNAITVTGINTAATISVTGGLYALSGGAIYTNVTGMVVAGDTVRVKQTSSGSFSTTTDAVLTIGGVPDTFSVTTLAADTTPTAFTFTDQTGVALNTIVESNPITVGGLNTGASISVTGGEYAINVGGYTNLAGTVINGDTVRVRQTSSGSFSTTTDTVLTIGGVSDTFGVTTLDPIGLFLPLIIK